MKLRPYQVQAVDAAWEHLQVHNATLCVQPTGTGKTVEFSELIRRSLPHGRCMVVADREELLAQASDKIAEMCGTRPDIEMAEQTAGVGMFKSPVVCALIQSLRSGNGVKRWTKFNPNEFALVVVDEADLSAADSYKAMLAHYRQNPNLKVFGCTATPDRHDEKALGEIFESVCFEYELPEAINEGWLVPILQQYLSVQIDFGGMHYTLGDFNGKELRELLAQGETIERIASDTIQYATDRRTLVFSDSVENAQRMTVAFNRHQLGCCNIVTGETPKDERRILIADYRRGAFQYLVNVGIALRGFDVPEIACVSMARPTCSRALYQQAIGRGTRPLPGIVDGPETDADRRSAIAGSSKRDLLILDVVGNSAKHKLVTAADILGGRYSDEIVAAAEESMRESGVPCDVADELEKAERLRNEQLKAEAERQDKLRLRSKSSAKTVDPFGFLGIERRASRGWEPSTSATEEQRSKLERWYGKDADGMSYSEAAQLIREFQINTRHGFATYKQKKLLVNRWKMSPEEAKRTSFAEAHRIIDILAANNWRRPKSVGV